MEGVTALSVAIAVGIGTSQLVAEGLECRDLVVCAHIGLWQVGVRLNEPGEVAFHRLAAQRLIGSGVPLRAGELDKQIHVGAERAVGEVR